MVPFSIAIRVPFQMLDAYYGLVVIFKGILILRNLSLYALHTFGIESNQWYGKTIPHLFTRDNLI